MPEGMNNPEMDDHGLTWPLVQSPVAVSCMLGVLGEFSHCTPGLTKIDAVGNSELHNNRDRIQNSWESGMADTLVAWVAIWNAGHLGPNYGRKA